jgi:ENTH domain
VLLWLDAEISEAAYDSEGYRQIMGVIARRLQDTGELWRHVYKSLLLLEYMLKHGPQKVGSIQHYHVWLSSVRRGHIGTRFSTCCRMYMQV